MVVLSFLIQLFGATFLLLFAVRMVRTGIERAFGASFRRLMTAEGPPSRLVPVGVLLAIILQSSAAVTLLAASFVGSGSLGFLPAMAVVLGGDLGSAILISILSLRVEWLASVLLTIGGILFLKTDRRATQQAGRIVLGVALVLISLRLLRETVAPIQEADFLPALSAFFERDFLTAFIVGAVTAFVLHSSVATILMVVTIIGMGALPFSVGASLVLGANLGSALIPVWLSRGAPEAARRVTWMNLGLRGIAALIVLVAINVLPFSLPPEGWGSGQALVALHIAFNVLVLMTLPLVSILEPVMRSLIPDPPEGPRDPRHVSALDDAALSNPARSLACLRREVLRMADILNGMLGPVMDLYSGWDPELAKRLRREDDQINAALDGIRRYSAAMPHDDMSKAERRTMRALVDYSIALEAAGDIVVKRLISLAKEKADGGLSFSRAGHDELLGIHSKVLTNLATATTVLVSEDVESARLLIEEKSNMSKQERNSRKKHLKRLTAGDTDSFGSSDVHLETAYSLKELNSWIVTVAHPILAREGQLLESRLGPEAEAK